MKKRILVAVVCVPVLFVVLFFFPPHIFTGVLSLICAISAYELLHAIGGIKGNERIAIYAVFSAVLIPIGAFFEAGALTFMAAALVLMSLMNIEAVIAFKTLRKIKFGQILTVIFAGALIPFMLSSLVSLKIMPSGRLFVLLPVISAFITDAGAYFTGILLGKKKAFPHISPKKTVEGFIGGLVIGVSAVVIYGMILTFTTFHYVIYWALIIYGIVGAFATELGDLSFSLIKREYNIKDYGRLLPGHGGMLDRFDSMIFTAPAIFLLTSLIPAIEV